jgi:hypothetical protein
MELRYMSGGLHLDKTDTHGRAAPIPSRLSTGSLPLFMIHTGDNSAGNGGNGYFVGSLINNSYAAFEPLNMAVAGSDGSANALQTNRAYIDQSATQIAGIGGDGGNGNAAVGGNVGLHGWIPSHVIATGDNSAGNGGDGHFFGAAVHAPVAVYNPINIAAAGLKSTAGAHQSNTVAFHQGATQVGGAGGDGGNDNLAKGGDVSAAGVGHESDHGLIGSDVIATGGNSAGNGGNGFFAGSLVHVSFALYNPINIAVAGYNSSADADQTNNVVFDQSAFQMAGVGGQGGNGNAALGGNVDIFSFEHGLIGSLIGSDVIAIGGNSAGNGGNGFFAGSLIDIDVAIFAPINIAVAGYNSAADAHQTNNVYFDQSTIQIAGVGGDGGHGNLGLGGDFFFQLLADHHVLDHLG